MKNQIKILCGAIVMVAAGSASGAQTWTLTGTPTNGAAVAAYSNTGGADTATSIQNNAAIQTLQAGTWVSSYGGIQNADGCTVGDFCDVNDNSTANWEHAIDNNQRYDMALVSFSGAKVRLSEMTLYNSKTDSDMTVLAYIGSGDPTTNGRLPGLTYSELVNATNGKPTTGGWVLVNHYKDVWGLAGHKAAINSDGLFSSYWLIGAYNSLVGVGTGYGGDRTLNDFVKLSSVAGCVSNATDCKPPSNVPEPGSLALFGLGLLGLVGARRSRKH